LLWLTMVAFMGVAQNASAAIVSVTVTIRNLAPANSVSFAPLRLGFGNGSFDAFNINQVATAPIVSVAEGGSGSDWFPAFAAAEPNTVLGSVGGALLPGATASSSFLVDNMSANNRFFTFGTMVIPSNDLFLGNDSPTAFQLFDASGNLLINTISQNAGQIWDAGSELGDPANAAFVVGGVNDNRTPQNGVVTFDRSELALFNGLTTAAGYVFSNAGLANNGTSIYEIGFSVTAVPEPSSAILNSLGLAGLAFSRRRKPVSELA
jgi:PEP-CTERM motif